MTQEEIEDINHSIPEGHRLGRLVPTETGFGVTLEPIDGDPTANQPPIMMVAGVERGDVTVGP